MVAWTLDSLQRVAGLSATLVVLAPDDSQFESQVPDFAGPKAWVARCGGATRAASVSNGLAHLLGRGATAHDWVLVHDAARCLIRPEWVERLIAECSSDAVGGLLALPLADTLKDGAGARVQRTIDRSDKWAAQTPQMFRIGALQHALAAAGTQVTDEAGAIEASGASPKLVRGDIENLKLTWPEDFALAQRLLASRRREDSGGDANKALFPARDAEPLRPMHRGLTMDVSSLRIGEGWDVHALVSGRRLVLGGVTVPHSHGLDGHSDADALAHAITDALLGAAALGDIGRHFPDSDPAFDGADSMNLLAETARRVHAAGFEVVNVDSTIVAQVPKLAPHIPAMRARLADTLGLDVGVVNVKAKTAEQMGPVGEGRAIEARAVCLLARR